MGKITGYAAIADASIQSDDLLLVVDVHDTSTPPAGAGGSDKKITIKQLTGNSLVVPPSTDGSGAADTAAIQAALLSFGTLSAGGQGAGMIVQLWPGQYHTNKPLIIPCGVTLRGAGFEATVIRLVNGADCDVIQWAQWATKTTLSAGISGTITSIPVAALPLTILAGAIVQVQNASAQTQNFTVTATAAAGATSIAVSSQSVSFTFVTGNSVYDATQAVLCGVNPSTIANAFYSCVRDLCVHGDSFGTTVPGYRHGISIITNPYSSAAGGDPDFDPCPLLENLVIEACTGDGFYHSGRGGALLIRVLSEYNRGNGFTPSFDATLLDCLANSNICAGFYTTHGSITGAGCKSYNNANGAFWVSGTAYSAGSAVVYNSVLYWCILAVSGTTVPSSDTTHWKAITAATSPQAAGCGYYWDGAQEQSWTGVDAQANSASDFYLKNTLGVNISGVSTGIGYGGAGPGNLATVVLDGAAGSTVMMSSTQRGSGAAGYALRVVNSATNNHVIMAGDTTGAATVSPDSVILPGSGNAVAWNGSWLSMALAGSFVPAVVTLTDAATIAVNAALGNDFRVTLGASRTMGSPSNPLDGQDITFLITQPASGGPYTMTWNSVYDFGAGSAPTLTTTASKSDLIGFKYVAALSKWVFMGAMAGLTGGF